MQGHILSYTKNTHQCDIICLHFYYSDTYVALTVSWTLVSLVKTKDGSSTDTSNFGNTKLKEKRKEKFTMNTTLLSETRESYLP